MSDPYYGNNLFHQLNNNNEPILPRKTFSNQISFQPATSYNPNSILQIVYDSAKPPPSFAPTTKSSLNLPIPKSQWSNDPFVFHKTSQNQIEKKVLFPKDDPEYWSALRLIFGFFLMNPALGSRLLFFWLAPYHIPSMLQILYTVMSNSPVRDIRDTFSVDQAGGIQSGPSNVNVQDNIKKQAMMPIEEQVSDDPAYRKPGNPMKFESGFPVRLEKIEKAAETILKNEFKEKTQNFQNNIKDAGVLANALRHPISVSSISSLITTGVLRWMDYNLRHDIAQNMTLFLGEVPGFNATMNSTTLGGAAASVGNALAQRSWFSIAGDIIKYPAGFGLLSAAMAVMWGIGRTKYAQVGVDNINPFVKVDENSGVLMDKRISNIYDILGKTIIGKSSIDVRKSLKNVGSQFKDIVTFIDFVGKLDKVYNGGKSSLFSSADAVRQLFKMMYKQMEGVQNGLDESMIEIYEAADEVYNGIQHSNFSADDIVQDEKHFFELEDENLGLFDDYKEYVSQNSDINPEFGLQFNYSEKMYEEFRKRFKIDNSIQMQSTEFQKMASLAEDAREKMDEGRIDDIKIDPNASKEKIAEVLAENFETSTGYPLNPDQAINVDKLFEEKADPDSAVNKGEKIFERALEFLDIEVSQNEGSPDFKPDPDNLFIIKTVFFEYDHDNPGAYLYEMFTDAEVTHCYKPIVEKGWYLMGDRTKDWPIKSKIFERLAK